MTGAPLPAWIDTVLAGVMLTASLTGLFLVWRADRDR